MTDHDTFIPCIPIGNFIIVVKFDITRLKYRYNIDWMEQKKKNINKNTDVNDTLKTCSQKH